MLGASAPDRHRLPALPGEARAGLGHAIVPTCRATLVTRSLLRPPRPAASPRPMRAPPPRPMHRTLPLSVAARPHPAIRDAGTKNNDIDRIQAWSGHRRDWRGQACGEVVRELWNGAQALSR